MGRRLSNAPMQVEFICPRCGQRLAWALPAVSMSCPYCGKWVTESNRKRECEVFLPIDSDQTVLFSYDEVPPSEEE